MSIFAENFDGVTAPAIPAGWTADTNIATSATTPYSGTNCLAYTCDNAVRTFVSSTADTAAGRVHAQCRMRWDAVTTQGECYLMIRRQSAGNEYHARIKINTTVKAVSMWKRVANSFSQLGSTVGDGQFAAEIWYTLHFYADCDRLSIRVQRMDNNQWMSAAGTWGASEVDCLVVNDGTFVDGGTCGLVFYGTATNAIRADDFQVDAITDIPITVKVGPYDTCLAAAGNSIDNTEVASAETAFIGQKYRARQAGTISRIKIYSASTTNLTGAWLKIWRKTGTKYDLVGTSNNFVASLVASTTCDITLATPIAGVQEGDYYSLRATYTGSGTYHFTARTGQTGVTAYHVTAADPSGAQYDWEAKTATAGAVVPIEMYMSRPYFVAIGDSIIGGRLAHDPYTGTATENSPATTAERYLSAKSARLTIYQNLGVSGNTTTQILARLGADCLSLWPTRYAILQGGVNDIDGAVAEATIIANWTEALNAVVGYGLRPVVCLIAPWTDGTNTEMQARDSFNAALTALCASTYPTAIVVNFDSYLGQFRVGGDAGNLWDIQAAYDGDGVHLSADGYAQYAQAIYDALHATWPKLVFGIDPMFG